MFRISVRNSFHLVVLLVASLTCAGQAEERQDIVRPAVVPIGSPILNLAFSPTGYLAYGGRNGVLGVLDPRGAKLWTAPVGTYNEKNASGTYGSDAHITGVGFIAGPKQQPGEVVVAASYDTSLRYFLSSPASFSFDQLSLSH